MKSQARSTSCNDKYAILNREDVECFICWNVLVNPQQCKNGHCFCKSCLQEYRQTNKPECPVCKVNISVKNTSEALFAKNVIQNMLVDCPAKLNSESSSCAWFGPHSNLAAHRRNECPAQRMPCPIHTSDESSTGGCPGTVIRSELTNHLVGSYRKAEAREKAARSLADSACKSLKEAQKEMQENVYTGSYNEDGDMEGFGFMKYADGSMFSGIWKKGMVHKGTYMWPGGQAFTGEFSSEGQGYAGNGELRSASGDLYIGTFDNNGAYCGQGRLELMNDEGNSTTVFEGSFKDNLLNGHCVVTGADYIFEGNFAHDVRCGFGKLTYTDGRSYSGEWKDDMEHGQGCVRNENGLIVHRGLFENGVYVSEHMVNYPEGSVYVGEWSHGWRNGIGTLTYASGAVYCGEWKNDKRQGQGVLTHKNGVVLGGAWLNDVLYGGGVEAAITVVGYTTISARLETLSDM